MSVAALIYPLVARAIFAEQATIHSSETTSVALLPTRGILVEASKDALMHKAAHYDVSAIRAIYGPETPEKAPTRPATPGEEEMLEYIKQKESSGNPTAQNPLSSAYGHWGFLDSTWATVGCVKTSDPVEQERCAILYMEQRYGGIEGAYYFHLQNNWY